MVEWLERLGYGAESRHKVVCSRLGTAMQRLENSLCQPSSKWIPFSNKGRLRQRKERDGQRLGTLTPTASKLWETFTFMVCLSSI